MDESDTAPKEEALVLIDPFIAVSSCQRVANILCGNLIKNS